MFIRKTMKCQNIKNVEENIELQMTSCKFY